MTRRKRRKKNLLNRNVGWLASSIVIASALVCLFLYLLPKIQSYKKKNIAVIHTSSELARITPQAGYHVETVDYSLPLRGPDGEIVFGFGRFLAAAFSTDGKLFAVSSTLGVFIWDAQALDGPPRCWIRGYLENVVKLQFSHDGKKLLTGSDKGNIHLVDIEKSKENLAYRAHPGTPIRLVAFSPDDSLFATASTDRYIRVWETDAGKLRNMIYCSNVASSLAFSSDNALLLYGANPNMQSLSSATPKAASGYVSVVYNLTREKEIELYEDESGAFAFTAFSPAEDKILIGGPKGVKAWDRQTSAAQTLVVNESYTAVPTPAAWDAIYRTTAAFSSHLDRFFYFNDVNNEIQFWDMKTGQYLSAFPWRNENLHPVAFNSEWSQILLHNFNSETVVLRDMASNRTISDFDHFAPGVQSVAFASGTACIATIHRSMIETRWDAASGRLLSKKFIAGSDNFDLSSARSLSPDKRYAVLQTEDGVNTYFCINDFQTGKQKVLFGQKSNAPIQSAFSPGSREILTTFGDYEFAVWDLETGAKRMTLDVLKTLNADFPRTDKYLPSQVPYYTNPEILSRYYFQAGTPAYSPDGKTILVCLTRILKKSTESRSAAILFDLETQQEKFHVFSDLDTIHEAIFSPDGEEITLNGNDSYLLIDSMTGQTLHRINKDHGMSSLLYSRSGKWRLVSGYGKPIQLMDGKTGTLIRTLGMPMQSASVFVFSPDDSQLLTGGEDGVVRLWKLAE